MVSLYLKPSAKDLHTTLKSAVERRESLETLADACQAIALSENELAAPFLYAAILEASYGPRDPQQIERALSLLTKAADHPFGQAMARFLKTYGAFEPITRAFQSRVPYDVWTQSRFYKTYRTGTLGAFQNFLEQSAPDMVAVPIICDIGPGNGVLLSDVVSNIFDGYKLPKLKVLLVEPFACMITASRDLLHKQFGDKIECVSLQDKIQDLSADKLLRAMGGASPWFVMASASLHHMPWEKKSNILKILAPLFPRLVLSEFEAPHDKPELFSPELVYSVTNSYGFYIEDVLTTCPDSEGRKWQCIDEFFMTEAIMMLTKDRLDRIDYHAPLAEWKDLAEHGGWRLQSEKITAWDGPRPITFTAVFDQG